MRLPTALAAFVCILLPAAAGAQSVDEIVAKNLKAKGGVEILRATTTVRMTAKVNDQFPMTILAKRPNLYRREVQMGGQSVVQASDGTMLWMRQPGGSAMEVPNAPEAAKREGEFDGVFMDYKSKGTTIVLVGNEAIDGKDTHHLKVTTKEGAVQDIYLDAETGLERKIVITMQQPGGATIKQEQMPSDYRDVDGRKMPFRIKNMVAGAPPVEIVIEKVEFNVPIDDAVFKLPK